MLKNDCLVVGYLEDAAKRNHLVKGKCVDAINLILFM